MPRGGFKTRDSRCRPDSVANATFITLPIYCTSYGDPFGRMNPEHPSPTWHNHGDPTFLDKAYLALNPATVLMSRATTLTMTDPCQIRI